MTLAQIAALYICLNILIFIWLTLRVIVKRRSDLVSLGDNDDGDLRKRIRSQANFAETAPLALIGLLAIAFLGGSSTALHIFGGALTAGRLLHAHGIMQKRAIGPGRPIGMLMTLLVLLGEALYIAYLIFTG